MGPRSEAHEREEQSHGRPPHAGVHDRVGRGGSGRGPARRDGGRSPWDELLETGAALRRLAAQPRHLAEAVAAVRVADCERLQRVVTAVGLALHCMRLCWWFCTWRCFLVCVTLCRQYLADLTEAPG